MGRYYSDYETKMRAFTALMKLIKWLVKKKLLKDVSEETCNAVIYGSYRALAREYISYNNYLDFSDVRHYESVSFYYASQLWDTVETWFGDKLSDE